MLYSHQYQKDKKKLQDSIISPQFLIYNCRRLPKDCKCNFSQRTNILLDLNHPHNGPLPHILIQKFPNLYNSHTIMTNFIGDNNNCRNNINMCNQKQNIAFLLTITIDARKNIYPRYKKLQYNHKNLKINVSSTTKAHKTLQIQTNTNTFFTKPSHKLSQHNMVHVMQT